MPGVAPVCGGSTSPVTSGWAACQPAAVSWSVKTFITRSPAQPTSQCQPAGPTPAAGSLPAADPMRAEVSVSVGAWRHRRVRGTPRRLGSRRPRPRLCRRPRRPPLVDGDGDRFAGVGFGRVDGDGAAQHRGDAEGVDRAHRVRLRPAVDVHDVRGGPGGERVRRADRTSLIQPDDVSLVQLAPAADRCRRRRRGCCWWRAGAARCRRRGCGRRRPRRRRQGWRWPGPLGDAGGSRPMVQPSEARA